MRSVDGKTLLEFLVLCLFEIVIVIAILMVVGVLPWLSLPANEPPQAAPASSKFIADSSPPASIYGGAGG